MEIRLIHQNDDRYAISRVYEKSWKYAYSGIIPQTYLNNIPKGNWVKTIEQSHFNSLVMIENQEIIGTTAYCKSRFPETAEFGEIVSLYLLPEYMGKGYGKILLQAAIRQLNDLGYQNIFLWVLAENKNAIHFYEKFGFKPSGRYLDDNIGGKDLRELQYIYHIV